MDRNEDIGFGNEGVAMSGRTARIITTSMSQTIHKDIFFVLIYTFTPTCSVSFVIYIEN